LEEEGLTKGNISQAFFELYNFGRSNNGRETSKL
jgi:hypothetical protein